MKQVHMSGKGKASSAKVYVAAGSGSRPGGSKIKIPSTAPANPDKIRPAPKGSMK